MAGEARDFAPFDIDGASAFIEELSSEVQRVYVEVWEGGDWQFVYGDERTHLLRLLALVTRNRPFRLRPVDFTNRSGPQYVWPSP